MSTYAGRAVKGYAKCNPNDEYVTADGMMLAAARCNLKVAEKRQARAAEKYEAAVAALVAAHDHLSAMSAYFSDSAVAVKEAKADLEKILNDM